MKKPRSVFIALLVCFLLLPGISTAENQDDTPKKNIGFIIINEKTSGITQKEFDELVISPISQTLCSSYEIYSEPKYYNKLKDAGYDNVIDAAKSDIIDILQDENLDYAIVIAALPVQIAEVDDSWMRWTFQAQMRIIDLGENRNLYSGKFISKDTVKRMTHNIVQVINETFLVN